MSASELCLVVDCNNMVIRAHAGMLKAGLATKAGIPTGGLFGSVRALNRYIQNLKPTHIACFWDFGRSSFRVGIAEDYKGDRPKSEYLKPGDLQQTFKLFEEYLNLIGVFHYKELNVEADDLIANCVMDHRDTVPITILSADHDLRQLVRQPDPYPVTVVKPSMSSTKPNEVTYTYQSVVDEYKLPPHRLAEIWAIEGDASDCQPAGTQVTVRRKIDYSSVRKCGDSNCSCSRKKFDFHCLNCRSLFNSSNQSWRCPECVTSSSQPIFYEYVEIPIEEVVVGDQVASYNGDVWKLEIVVATKEEDYQGPLVVVESESGLTSKYTPGHYCMSKIGDLEGQYYVYLMKRGTSYRIGKSRFSESARRFEEGADSIWILSVHEDEHDCLLQEQILSYKYGIPDLVFVDEKKQLRLDSFWSSVGDITYKAKQCLEDFGLDFEYPYLSSGLRGRQSPSRYLVKTRAANLLSGMSVSVRRGSDTKLGTGEYERISVSREEYSGKIYSLSVTGSHLYVADGILTHNCIRGVPGFGAVKSFRAIQEYGSLSNAIANHPKLAGYERQIHNNYRMIKLPSEVETVTHQLEEYYFPKAIVNSDLRAFFELYELQSLVMKYDAGALFDEEIGMKSGFGHL